MVVGDVSLAALPMMMTDGFIPCPLAEANRLLVRWEHKMGELHRPFRSEPWLFLVDGEPMALAISASTVSATVGGFRRREVVELARICSRVDWANRLMLRWWREVAAQRWESWPVQAAVSYGPGGAGNLYRFDGWKKIREGCGSNGGGTWTKRRAAGSPLLGPKDLSVWNYAS